MSSYEGYLGVLATPLNPAASALLLVFGRLYIIIRISFAILLYCYIIVVTVLLVLYYHITIY